MLGPKPNESNRSFAAKVFAGRDLRRPGVKERAPTHESFTTLQASARTRAQVLARKNVTRIVTISQHLRCHALPHGRGATTCELHVCACLWFPATEVNGSDFQQRPWICGWKPQPLTLRTSRSRARSAVRRAQLSRPPRSDPRRPGRFSLERIFPGACASRVSRREYRFRPAVRSSPRC